MYATLLGLLLTFPLTDHWERLLDADDFRTREKATRCLCRDGSLSVLRALTRSAKPEVKHRARFVYRCRKDEILRSLEPFPFIDSMWWSMERHTYCFDTPWHSRLERYICWTDWDCKQPFEDYRRASAVWASDMIDAGMPVWAIRLLFWELHRRDADFLRHFGFYQPG